MVRKHTEETKLLMSQKRKAYLAENKDKHNWSRFRNKESVPECKFREALISLGISATQFYIPPESERYFELDFVLVENKIGFEINGQQHYSSDGNLSSYYQERHNYLNQLGWIIHEIHYSECFKSEKLHTLIINCIKNIDIEYTSSPAIVNHRLIRKREKEERKQKEKELKLEQRKLLAIEKQNAYELRQAEIATSKLNKSEREHEHAKSLHLISPRTIKGVERPESRKVVRPSKEELAKLIWEQSTAQLAKQFGVSDKAVEKWCKFYGIPKPPRGYWAKTQFKFEQYLLTCFECGKSYSSVTPLTKYCSNKCRQKASWKRVKLRKNK